MGFFTPAVRNATITPDLINIILDGSQSNFWIKSAYCNTFNNKCSNIRVLKTVLLNVFGFFVFYSSKGENKV